MREAVTDTLRKHRSIVLAFALAIVLFLIGTVQASGFASYDHVRTILITASFIGLVGVGQTLCMLTGGIDLSIPSNLAGAAVLTAFLANGSNASLVWIIPLVIGLGAVVGLINGLGVAYAGVPPIIMTLGMNSAIQGLMLIYTHGGLAAAAPTKLVSFANGDTLGVSTMLLFWLGVDDRGECRTQPQHVRAQALRGGYKCRRRPFGRGRRQAGARRAICRFRSWGSRDRCPPARIPRPGVHHDG